MYKTDAPASSNPHATTPMMAQYLALKEEAGSCLLFYRMGDFYELFFEDAKAAAAALDIALTRRGSHDGADVPMCGVPVHAADQYLARLIRAGFRVAIAEQVEDPAEARKRGVKSVVARAIVRVVTPGTITEDGLLDARAANHLAALARAGEDWALAWCDVSTGDFRTLALPPERIEAELARLNPAELLLAQGLEWISALPPAPTYLPPARFDSQKAEALICARFGVATSEAFGHFSRAELSAIAALLGYVAETQKAADLGLLPPVREMAGAVMAIDAATRQSLELVRTQDGQRKGSLLATLDRTLTGAGARALAQDIAAPLTSRAPLEARLDVVQWFFDDQITRAATRELLRQQPDLERALQRLALGRGGPRDLAHLRDGLEIACTLRERLEKAMALGAPALLQELTQAIQGHGALIDQLQRALVPEPPMSASDGGFIATGFDAALDSLKSLAADARRHIAALEAEYRTRTHITALKIKHNNVLGYHVEVAAKYGDALMLPDSGFTHRQTLAGVVRFNSVELAELAQKIAGAQAHALESELRWFGELREAVLGHAAAILNTAQALARLDVGAALAERAGEGGWVRPTLHEDQRFHIVQGRHPVVEEALAAQRQDFIANDCNLSSGQRLWLVTGPNMAGKSTFLRQNALIAVLAQAGSFVPAQSADIGLVDRLFSRVGASDNLAQGRSTFMVEMVETAAILRQATARSLVVLDEVGRGTATFDGLSIAWAVVEALHDQVGARALFATHYHELTELGTRLSDVALAHVRVREWKGELVFLHEVGQGVADKSYGLAVARLAGMPAAVVQRAGEILARLEKEGSGQQGARAALDALPLFAATPAAVAAPQSDALREKLAEILPDSLTPRAALDLLYELKALASQAEDQ